MTDVSLGKPDKLNSAITHLSGVIDDRVKSESKQSYTALLFQGGIELIKEKFIEESTELCEAIESYDKDAIAHETADVLFHLFVALRKSNVSLDAVANKLIERQSQSGIEEKNNRIK